MKLDLGCGESPVEGHVGVDLPADDFSGGVDPSLGPQQARLDPRGIVRFDLASGIPWPFADGSVESLHSSHLIEHLPATDVVLYQWSTGGLGQHVLRRTGTRDALCWFMQEAWRVTRPGGEFLLRWPAMVDERTGTLCLGAFVDPSHRRFVPLQQMQNWSRKGRELLPAHHLGIDCNWTIRRTLQRPLGRRDSIENEALLVRED